MLRDNLATYLTEKFRGKLVQMSDDSMLTLFALRKGKTVHQSTAFAFTLMPETLGRHARQQLRWMRGSFIRSWWRFRYLPLGSPAYWFHAARWLQYVAVTAVLFALLGTGLVFNPLVLLWSFVVLAAVRFSLSARYLSVSRSDQSTAGRFGVYALVPLAALWSTIVLRCLRWWALLTIGNVNWGTRDEVENRVVRVTNGSTTENGKTPSH